MSRGKSIRKRIRASFRMRSTREKKKSVTAMPNAPELNAGTAGAGNDGGGSGKPAVLKDKRIRNLLTVAAVSDTDTETEEAAQ